jgi:hypothetical protein
VGQARVLIRETRIPLQIMLVEAAGDLVDDELGFRIHDAEAVLSSVEVVVGERLGQIQIDRNHKSNRAEKGITTIEILAAAHC